MPPPFEHVATLDIAHLLLVERLDYGNFQDPRRAKERLPQVVMAAALLGSRLCTMAFLEKFKEDSSLDHALPRTLKMRCLPQMYELYLHCGSDFKRDHKNTYALLQRAVTVVNSKWKLYEDPLQFATLEAKLKVMSVAAGKAKAKAKARSKAMAKAKAREVLQRALRINDVSTLHSHIRSRIRVDHKRSTSGKFNRI